MVERESFSVASPPGGWGPPWPNVAEIEAVLPHEKWTLVGGLMTQLHGIHRGIDTLRPTNDVDIVLHVETTRAVAAEAVMALESLGYELKPSMDERRRIAYRFERTDATAAMVNSRPDVVDVLMADHAAPSVTRRLRGQGMVAIEGGTQALRRTLNARLEIAADRVTTVSVPSPFGALILKGVAYLADSRDKVRHLEDAVLLLAVIEDPYAERELFTGSDRARLRTLRQALPDDARVWRSVPPEWQDNGRTALRILLA